MVLDNTHVHLRNVAWAYTLEWRDGLTGDEDLVTILREVVEIDSEILEETDLETEIHLLGKLPSYALVSKETFADRMSAKSWDIGASTNLNVILEQEP